MKYLIIAILLIAQPVKAEISFFTTDTLYQNPITYPRTPQFSTDISKKNGKIDIQSSFGKSLGLITFNDTIQLGFEIGSWFTLRHMEDTAFNLISEDFILSIPLSFRFKKLSGAIKYNHISAHLGDGARDILTNIYDTTYSREFISFHLAYLYINKSIKIKYHAHYGYIFIIYPEEMGNYFTGGGLSLSRNKIISPYISADYTYNGDVKAPGIKGFLGIKINRKSKTKIPVAIGLTGYYGSDRRGRLFNKKMKRLGIGMLFQ